MPDLTSDLLPRLQSHRLPGLDLGDEFIHPHYEGGSILNIPSTICRLLDVPGIGAQPLIPEILDPIERGLAPGIRRVVMVLMDALSLHRLQRWLRQGGVPLWGSLLKDGLLAPLTSVVPSTTSAALPTLWSGLSPAQHAMVGYELWLKEYGVVANMIQQSPFNVPGSLEKAGFEPEKALPGPTLGTHLASYGVNSYAFQHFTIARSGLSRVFFTDVDVRPFGTAVELVVNLRKLIESRSKERQLIGVYWGQVDHFSHVYGPDDERVVAEFAHFTAAFSALFYNKLRPNVRKDTLLILTADHGQVATRKAPHFDLRNHPGLAQRLPILPTGENRFIYFNIRPDQTGAVQEYLDHTFAKQFIQVDPANAMNSGLFGPGEPHPQLRDRLGDMIAIARGDAYLWWGKKENPLIGRHGGMSPDEMLVPLLAVRL
ncbi:MAG: alkaline phosphatase family protein [Anaerolineales bacterium]